MQLLLIRVYVEFKKPNSLKEILSAVYSCVQKRCGRRAVSSARRPYSLDMATQCLEGTPAAWAALSSASSRFIWTIGVASFSSHSSRVWA
jgi:hypothetical protein